MNPEIRQYLDHLVNERHLSDNTVDAYHRDLTALAAHLDGLGRDWADVKPATIKTYQALGEREGLRRASLVRRLATFRGFFHWLARQERIDTDPMLSIERPKDTRAVPEALSEAEVGQLLDAPDIPARDRAMLELMYWAALKASDLVALNLSDLNLIDGHVRTRTDGDKPRTLPLTESTIQALTVYVQQVRHHLRRKPHERALFLNYAGNRISRQLTWKTVKDAAHAAGLPHGIGPHTLRFSRATHLIEGGIDLRDLQEFLGHADISTTQQYRRLGARPVEGPPAEPVVRRRPGPKLGFTRPPRVPATTGVTPDANRVHVRGVPRPNPSQAAADRDVLQGEMPGHLALEHQEGAPAAAHLPMDARLSPDAPRARGGDRANRTARRNPVTEMTAIVPQRRVQLETCLWCLRKFRGDGYYCSDEHEALAHRQTTAL